MSARGSKSGTTRVKTARNRTAASTRWLARQLNDPYVKRAKAEGYRSRAAYKLIELDEKYGLLKGGARLSIWGLRRVVGRRWCAKWRPTRVSLVLTSSPPIPSPGLNF